MSQIAANVAGVCRRIQAAALRGGRRPEEVTLVAVTKTCPPAAVIEAYRAGLRHFGENRADEGREKALSLGRWLEQAQPGQAGLSQILGISGRGEWSFAPAPEISNPPGQAPTWHFIGHLQRRQAADVLGHFQVIHSVDSLRLAERIQRLAERDDRPPVEVLLQCNVSGEETKSGFQLDRWAADRQQLAEFLKTAGRLAAFDRIVIRGLMTMAPWTPDPEQVRPVFSSLAALRDRLQQELPDIEWRHLSMGMTDDFEVAVEEGATIVRIGRAIFGERDYT